MTIIFKVTILGDSNSTLPPPTKYDFIQMQVNSQSTTRIRAPLMIFILAQLLADHQPLHPNQIPIAPKAQNKS